MNAPSPEEPKKKVPLRKRVKFFLICLVALSILVVFRNFVLRQVISLGAHLIIGAPVTIEKLSIKLREQEVEIERRGLSLIGDCPLLPLNLSEAKTAGSSEIIGAAS